MSKLGKLGVWLLSIIMLSGCSSNISTIYDETLSESDKKDIESIVADLADGFTARYNLDDATIDILADLFVDPSGFKTSFLNYKQRKQDENADGTKLYIDRYIQKEKEYFEEAKEFGLSHGLLYTNGRATNINGSIDIIEPLKEGETIISDETMVDETIVNETIADETIADETIVNENMTDEATSDEILTEDEYVEAYRQSEILSRMSNIPGTKEELIDYINTMEVPYDMDEDSLGILYEGISSYKHSAKGLSQEEIDAMSYDDLYDWLYQFEECKQDLIEEEDKYLKDLEENYDKYLEEERIRIQERLEQESEMANEVSLYEQWRIDNKDIIEFIEIIDFETPLFSEVIEHDENGYYIPWEKIYALADEEGRLTEYLEFIAYGQTVNIKMPEAPLSYYADKKVSVVDWSVVVKEAGGEFLSLTLSLPDKLNYVTIELGLAEDNKLYYNSDIATYIFD